MGEPDSTTLVQISYQVTGKRAEFRDAVLYY